MRKVKIIWTPQAQEDLRQIERFIARDAPRTARALIRRLKASVDRLKSFPESGAIVSELGDPEIREILHGTYRIIYQYRAKKWPF
jgi:plasmid stabilization system protein ParE